MTIQCENCRRHHDLDPPSWVLGSGRAFRFRCAECGHSQSVRPDAASPYAHVGPQSESFGHDAMPDFKQSPLPAPLAVTPDPVHQAPPISPPQASQGHDPLDDFSMAETDMETEHGDGTLYVKQGGQVYVVPDWDTLRDWIEERRIDEDDLLSEGGVRWDPVASHPEVADCFAPTTDPGEPPEVEALHEAPPVSTPPFWEDVPFEEPWHDNDTDGVPTGLPPLPDPSEALRAATPPPATASATPPPSIPHPTPSITPLPPERAPAPDEVPAPLMAQVEMYQETPQPGRTVTPTAAAGRWEDLLADSSQDHAPVAAPFWDDAAPVHFDFDDQFEALERRPGKGVPWMAAAGVALGVGGLIAYLLLGGPNAGLAEMVVADPGLTPTAPARALTNAEPDPEVEPVEVPPPSRPAAQPAPEPPPAPVAAPAPAPAPEPRIESPPPAPAPPTAPRTPPAQRLVDQGWSQIDSDPEAARRAFKKVLDTDPSHHEANYGYGYSLLVQSHPDAADYLCRARTAKNPEIRQDVVGLIASHSLSCP